MPTHLVEDAPPSLDRAFSRGVGLIPRHQLRLLGEEEVRAIQAVSAQAPTAASPPQPQPKSPPPQPPPSKPGGRLTAQATPTAKPLAPIGVAPAGQQPDSDAGAGKQRRGSVITGQAKRPPKNR